MSPTSSKTLFFFFKACSLSIPVQTSDFSACNRKELIEEVKKYLLERNTHFVFKAYEIKYEFS